MISFFQLEITTKKNDAMEFENTMELEFYCVRKILSSDKEIRRTCNALIPETNSETIKL